MPWRRFENLRWDPCSVSKAGLRAAIENDALEDFAAAFYADQAKGDIEEV